MAKPKHIQLLEELEIHGVGYVTDISKWLSDNYTLYQTEREFNREVSAAARFVSDLVDRSYLAWDEDENEMSRFYFPRYDHNSETQDWFQISRNVDIQFQNLVYLKSTGLDCLSSYRNTVANIDLNRSYKDVNEASITNYVIQKRGLIITGVIAFIAALFSVFGFFKAEPKMVELNKNIRELSKETRGIKVQIDSLRNQITLSSDSSHR